MSTPLLRLARAAARLVRTSRRGTDGGGQGAAAAAPALPRPPDAAASDHVTLTSLTLAAHGFVDADLCQSILDDAALLLPHEIDCLGLLGASVPPGPAAPADIGRAFAALASTPARQLLDEWATRTKHPATAIIAHAVLRALANRLAISPLTLSHVAELHGAGTTADFLLTKADPQAVGFMVDVLAALRGTLLPRLAGSHLSVLDLGAKSGAGSQLMAYLGQSGSFSKLKFSVTCADIDPTFRDYAAAKHPHVEYLNADVFDAGRQWDVVICSHVVEHVPDPVDFVQRLRGIARRIVVLAFPYMEDPGSLIPGHLHSLGHGFLRQIGPARYEIYDGLFWSQSLCCVAVLEMGT